MRGGFGSTNRVAGKDLLSNGETDLVIGSLMAMKWFSPAGGVLDCEGVDWGVFDLVLLAPIGL